VREAPGAGLSTSGPLTGAEGATEGAGDCLERGRGGANFSSYARHSADCTLGSAGGDR